MTIKQDYEFAGHRVRIEGRELVEAVTALPGFNVFAVKPGISPLCRFVEDDESAVPPFTQVYYNSDTEFSTGRFGKYKEGYLLEKKPLIGSPLYIWTDKRGHISRFAGNMDPMLVRYGCWLAYGLATIRLQTIAIHTSAIIYKDKTVLFLGESGTGKSTHTRLWRENIEGAVLLNDDSPIVRIVDGKPWAYGSPWSGKTPCYKNESYPLVACVRLSQAPYNKIKKLNTLHAYGAMHPSCPPDFAYDDALYDPVSHTLNLMLSSVPVYHLACLPDANAARLSCETIFRV